MADLDQTVFALLDRAAEPVAPDAPVEEILRGGRRRQRRRRLMQGGSMLAAAAAVAAIVLVALNVGGSTGNTPPIGPGPVPPPVSGPTAQQIADGHWTNIPAAPFTYLCQPTAAWDGHELLVVNADARCLDTVVKPADLGKAAAYDPRHNSWRPLARAPLDTSGPLLSTWTRTRLVVVAPATGKSAAYDPVSNTWRLLADASPSPSYHTPSLVTVAPKAVLVGLGGEGTGVVALEGDHWRPLASIPVPQHQQVTALAAGVVGQTVYAVATFDNVREITLARTDSSALLAFGLSDWAQLPRPSQLPRVAQSIASVDGGVVVVGSDCLPGSSCPATLTVVDLIRPGERADLVVGNWPFNGADGNVFAAGRALIAYNGRREQDGSAGQAISLGDTAVYDVATDHWLNAAQSVTVNDVVAKTWTPYGFVVLGSPAEKCVCSLGGLILRPAPH